MIQIIGDSVEELTETFRVTLSVAGTRGRYDGCCYNDN